MPLTYNIKDAADRLGVSRQWLRKFLRQHPADNAGTPFYVPIGNRKRFTDRDLERILEANRETERELLSSRTSVFRISTTRDQAAEEPWKEKIAVGGSRIARALVPIKEQD
jgi:DNA-binding transcriptional MerR regulator